MGWQDDAVVDETPAPAWHGDPVVDEKAPPSMGQVALNAVPKGIANLLNTPVTLKNLIMSGIAALPGAGHFKTLQDNADPTPNYPMEVAKQAGIVDPDKDPQTGLQRVVDTAIQTGIGAAAGPGSALKNAAVGAGSGTAAQVTKEATGSDALGMVAGLAAPTAGMASNATKVSGIPKFAGNEVRQATIKASQKAGYVIPPSLVNPTFSSNRIESIAGKGAVPQEAALRNQEVTNKLAAKAIGLPEDTALTMPVLKEAKQEANKVYKEIAELSPRAAGALSNLQQTRFEAKEQWNYYNRSGNPEAGTKARALDAKAHEFEQVIDDEAKKIVDVYEVKAKKTVPSGDPNSKAVAIRPTEHGNEVGFPTPSTGNSATTLEMEKAGQRWAGRADLLDDLRRSRARLAKIYTVEKALNTADGNIDAHIIGKLMDRGAPLTGELETIGNFAQAFPKMSREASTVPPPHVSGADAASSAMLGTIGYGTTGPAGLLAAGLPLLRGPARHRIFSESYQSKLLEPVVKGPTSDLAIRGAMVGKTLYDILGAEGAKP